MKFIGIAFIIITMGSFGFKITAEYKKQCDDLRQLLTALRILRNEISFCGTPLSKAFAMMAVPCAGMLQTVLSNTAREMERHSYLSPVAALKTCGTDEMNEPFMTILLEMLNCFGSYDLQSQVQSVDWARQQCEERLCILEQERKQKSKVYETLGICAGMAVSILLI